MIRVFIIEDHQIIVSGFKTMFRPLRDGIEVAGNASGVDDAIADSKILTSDVIILDLWLPGPNPLANIKKLQQIFPKKPVVILTSEESPAWQRKMLEAGARAYILKSAERQEIKITIEKVVKGMAVYSSLINEDDGSFSTLLANNQSSLSEKELEIIKLLSEDYTQASIASKTGIGVSNVEKIIKTLKVRYNVRSTISLIKLMVEKGIV